MFIKKLVKDKGENSQTFFNFLSTVISSGIAFITMPIFTRLLGTEQYGYYSIYHAWLVILTCFMGACVHSSLGTGFYKFKDRYYEFKSSVLLEGSVISLAIIAMLLLTYPITKSVFGYTWTIFIILLLHGFASYIVSMANSGWTYEKKAASNMALSATLLVITSILSILLLTVIKIDGPLFYGRVYGIAIPYIVIALLIWVPLFRKSPCGYNKDYWKYGLQFGMPMIFHLLSHQVLGQSDRLMMQWFQVDYGEIGRYSFFYSFVAILTTILNALNTSWCPFLFDDLHKENYKILNKKIKNYVQIFVVLSLGFLLVSREVMKLFANADYWSGARLIPILVMVVYCTFFYQFAVNYEFFNEKPKYVAMGTVAAAILNIGLNALMIPKWGMYGAAVATLLSYAMLAVLHTTIVKTWSIKRYPLTYKPVITGLLIVIAGCTAYYLLAELVLLRWIMAVLVGGYLVISVIKRKTIF